MENQTENIYGNDGLNVTKLAMFCQNILTLSYLKENNVIPLLSLDE